MYHYLLFSFDGLLSSTFEIRNIFNKNEWFNAILCLRYGLEFEKYVPYTIYTLYPSHISYFITQRVMPWDKQEDGQTSALLRKGLGALGCSYTNAYAHVLQPCNGNLRGFATNLNQIWTTGVARTTTQLDGQTQEMRMRK